MTKAIRYKGVPATRRKHQSEHKHEVVLHADHSMSNVAHPEVMPNRIRSMRGRRCLQQDELAKLCGVSRVTVSYWETCKKSPSDKHKKVLCAVLGCDINDLFDWR